MDIPVAETGRRIYKTRQAELHIIKAQSLGQAVIHFYLPASKKIWGLKKKEKKKKKLSWISKTWWGCNTVNK